jgi:hypothetical protein
MSEDNLDKFPTLGVCVSCAAEIKYSPIRMPLGRPHINADRPGHYSIEYAPMCVPCIRGQLDTLTQKVNLGEMYPTHSWEASEKDGSFHIVPITQSSPPVVEDKKEPEAEEKPGLISRIIRRIY